MSNYYHPLHTKEFLVYHINQGNRKLPGVRCTGRTTILILKGIVHALENPYTNIFISDHDDYVWTVQSTKSLFNLAASIIDRLGFKHLHLDIHTTGYIRLMFAVRDSE